MSKKTTMDLFLHAARLNNEGVTALLEGKDEAAVASLIRSIEMMKQELLSNYDRRTTINSANPASSANNGDFSKGDGYCDHRSSRNTDTPPVHLPGFQAEGDASSVLFTRAVVIPEVRRNGNEEQDIHIYTAAVIFNMALVYHRQGKRSDTTVCMKKAEKLYSMLLQILNNDMSTKRVALTTRLAAINNLSQVRFERGEYELARTEGLRYLSAFMHDCGNQPMLEEPEIQSLILNILLLDAPKIAPAA
jgi:hypothetical protein